MSESESAAGGHYFIEILDGQFSSRRFDTSDPVLTGRQIAELGGRRPPEDFFILMRGPEGGLRELAEDEGVNVRETSVFWAIAGDRLFRFVLDGIQYDWPIALVPAEILYRIGEVDVDARVIVLLQPEGQNRELNRGDFLDLANRGTEKLASVERKKHITIFIDDKSYKVDVDHLSGLQIKSLAGIEASYQLFLRAAWQR